MAKVAQQITFAGFHIDRKSATDLGTQLYSQLRDAILCGRLRPGDRLPSTRLLAKDLSISRNTALAAYEQMRAEGYLDTRAGSGARVATSIPDEALSHGPRMAGAWPRLPLKRLLSARGKLLSQRPARPLSISRVARPFESGLPDPSTFPFKTWAALMNRHWRRPPRELLTYGDPAGFGPLREAIAFYLRTARAVRCESDQIFIVNGSQQALDLAARLLIDPGDEALVEDPGYPGAHVALHAAGASVLPMRVDDEGADAIASLERSTNARLIFLTPSHQFPLGVTLSLERRLRLIACAKRRQFWILEDDYDSEYRFTGKPLPSLQGLDTSGRVIYLGSFSKTLLPSLRLGFLVLPPQLVEPFRRARSVIDGHSPLTEQAVLADFISEGHFTRHIRRMRVLYQERQSILVEAIDRELMGTLTVKRPEGGMHVVAWLPKGTDDLLLSEYLSTRGIFAYPLSRCSSRRLSRGGLLLGYAALSRSQIQTGVRRLAQALSNRSAWKRVSD
jgi:GntR family transcriptional regulator / MocR family aminotransferase